MPWLTVFIASWIIFFILIRKNQPIEAYLAGPLAIIFQLSIDVNARYLDLYYIHGDGYFFHGSPLYFTFGPVFTMAVLFVQYLPKDKWWQSLHILVFVSLFFVFEVIIEIIDALEYVHWNHLGSIFVDVTVFMALGWYGTKFVKKLN
ncbi:hypothetical protein [Desulfuribacillus alkaliarsenatis]|uniref:Uncharacterized protein n=1 Tax=Desulfuribacillus alkaliarsenatis TaxID=766136 RepID=A0A1E5G4V0_9FIRM|nr:hypothetical protein [Desulfuribacillus alkaliarsenatis]OEF98212.1 hypothetical protein BHF68_00550 [Desulfuribacillus alkaliarsenatis]